MKSKEFRLNIQESNERKRILKLKKARRNVIVLSTGFVISMICVLFAFAEYQEATAAKIDAENSKKEALIYADEAKKSESLAEQNRAEALSLAKIAQENLIIAKENENKAIEMTQKALAESKRARDMALIAEKNSQIAQNKSKIAEDALVLAKKNADDALFQKNVANTKIEQQIARSNAILAQQEYLNGNYLRGYEIAKNAYKQNKINSGNPFDKDILAALYEGYNFLHQKKFIGKNQINNIQMGSKPGLFAFSSIDDSLSVVNEERILKLKIENLKSFSFIGKSELIINQYPNRLFKFNINEGSFTEEIVFSDHILSINKVKYEGLDHFFVCYRNNFELLDGSLKSKGQWSNDLNISSLKNYKDQFISLSGGTIQIIDLNVQGDVSLIQEYNFDNNISSVSSVFESTKIAIGFENGNFLHLRSSRKYTHNFEQNTQNQNNGMPRYYVQ